MEKISSENVFAQDAHAAPLRLIAMNGATELGDRIERHLLNWAHK